MSKYFKLRKIIIIYWLLFNLISCKKAVDIDPPKTQLTSETVFNSDATATAAQLAIYSQMVGQDFIYFLSLITGLTGDELNNYSSATDYMDLHTNNIISTNGSISNLWSSFYRYIYQANSILEGVSNSNNLSSTVKNQLKGEAKFIRAFSSFYLVNLFGEIPIITSTDYKLNSTSTRKPVAEVYKQLIDDLKNAKDLLPNHYVSSNNSITTERIRPNKWAAASLLSRVYLFAEDWLNAEIQASEVIDQTNKYNLVQDLNNVFLKNNREAIWQLMPVVPQFNTPEGGYFILRSIPSSVAFADHFEQSFDSADHRKSSWINNIKISGQTFYYPFKYKVPQGTSGISEYSTLIRLAELYLIRSEARVHLGNLGGAITDLNIIRSRAGLPNSIASSKEEILDAIFDERGFELFTEYGHRWLDIKRMNREDVLRDLKAPQWQRTDLLYPIPQSEINNNSNFTQNPGY